MSIDAIKQELANLDLRSRKHLVGYLLSLNEREEDPEYIAKLGRLIDDKEPSHWITLDEMERKLNIEKNDRQTE
jgi:hypothetical protein